MKDTLVLSVLGRPGSGKGTQAEYLKRDFGFASFSTGALLRKRAKNRDYTGRRIGSFIENGDIVPSPITFFMWMPELESFKQKNVSRIIIDGTPRKILEAYILDDVVEWYDWKNMKVLNIKISEKEAIKRLVKRGRSDDELSDIKNRLQWFKKDVEPVLRYYKKKGMLLDINGEQSREYVYKEIKAKLKL
ncbi:MAG: nucleoside monophosphate kinase [Patescibacteria group bacterium]|nr:nucleoside monophosphate kinase [Patescibacteria group bacterium]